MQRKFACIRLRVCACTYERIGIHARTSSHVRSVAQTCTHVFTYAGSYVCSFVRIHALQAHMHALTHVRMHTNALQHRVHVLIYLLAIFQVGGLTVFSATYII